MDDFSKAKRPSTVLAQRGAPATPELLHAETNFHHAMRYPSGGQLSRQLEARSAMQAALAPLCDAAMAEDLLRAWTQALVRQRTLATNLEAQAERTRQLRSQAR